MNTEKLTDAEAIEKIREYVAPNCGTTHYPVPAEWVSHLLGLYQACDGAIPPLPDRRYVAAEFADMSEVRKLTYLYREVEGANTCGLPTPMVPGSWVVWLLSEYDRLCLKP
jgi:hypothetical protein